MSSERFATVTTEEYEKIMKEKNSVNTHCATNVAWNTFCAYIEQKKYVFEVMNISKEELNAVLTKFYLEASKNASLKIAME